VLIRNDSILHSVNWAYRIHEHKTGLKVVTKPKAIRNQKSEAQAKGKAGWLAAIVEGAHDAIISEDLEGVITTWNVAAQKLYGYTPAEAIGKPITLISPMDRIAEEAQSFERLRRGAQSIHFETIRRRKDGSHVEISLTISPVRDRDGKLIGASGIAQDITKRKQAEGAVQKSEQHLRNVLNTLFSFVGVLAPDGTLLEVNRSALQVSGVAFDDVYKKKFWDCFWWSYSTELQEKIRHAVERAAAGEPSRFDVDALLVGNRFLPIDFMIAPMRDERGQITHLIPSATDLSERKRAEEALREAQAKLRQHADDLETIVAERTGQLRQSNDELEAFSYSLSHDMRAPLRAMQGYAGMVLEDFGAVLGDNGRDYLVKIRGSASRMDRLVQDVLALAQLSREPISFENISLEQLISEIVDERPEFQAPRAEIILERPLLEVSAHQASVTQCLTNLLDNAVKFVKPGVTPQVRIRTEPAGDFIKLWIEDNGIGIDENSQSRLFQIFTRLHAVTEYQGSGIGLAIVRKAVERMGGQAGLETEPGKGSRFWLELPRSVPPSA
jgi:PAS domain S-box-containing protein